MFLHDLFIGLWVAFVLMAPVTVVTAIGSKHVERVLLAGIGMVVFYGIINWLVFWWGIPAVGLTKIAIYHEYWLLSWALVLGAIAIGLAAVDWDDSNNTPWPTIGSGIITLALVVALIYGIAQQGVWTGSRAKTLAHEARVTIEKQDVYPNTDPNHILQVPEETANFYANQVLANSSNANLGTIFQVGTGTLQSVDNHLYWIYGLEPSSYRNSTRLPNSEVPGYVVVDAENPNVPAQLKTGYHMEYYEGGYHGHKLERYLFGHGYRASVIGDPTLEVNDQWRPYYTASLERVSVGFQEEVPGKMLLIDPQTGSTTQYPIGKEPEWVDRLYSQSKVETMLNWWGKWGQAPYRLIGESSANRYKVAPGESPVLVYTTGGHPVWQAIMTSYNRDTSAAYLALFDARDNKVRLFRIPDLTLASRAEQTILNSNANLKKLQPVHLSLHRIYGQLTWVAPLIKPQSGGEESDSSSAFQGIALLRADDLNGGSVVLASSMATALTEYRQVLASGSNNSGPEQNANTTTVTGVVATLSSVVENSQTVFYFTLKGDPAHVYRAQVTSNGTGSSYLELPFIKVGAKVSLTYLNTGAARRDVGAYQDIGMQLEAK